MSDEHLRLSDGEREQAAAELGEHYVQGRLTADEHAERLDQIWATRTRGELTPIFRDLPGTAYAAASGVVPGGRLSAPRAGRGSWPQGRVSPWHRGLPTPLFVILAVLLVITVITHLPLILIGLLVWFFLVARHRNRHHARHW
jgi:hypothetical protein